LTYFPLVVFVSMAVGTAMKQQLLVAIS